jgi:hypothetical protein
VIRRALATALKGQNIIAQGKRSAALGNAANKSKALKGRNRISIRIGRTAVYAALSGLIFLLRFAPGALPRAITLRPFKADKLEAVV